jgi:hypothetical protein
VGSVAREREKQRGKAAGSGELWLADNGISGDGKSTDGFHMTSRINQPSIRGSYLTLATTAMATVARRRHPVALRRDPGARDLGWVRYGFQRR